MIEPPCTERYARWCERSASQLMGSLLLDFRKAADQAGPMESGRSARGNGSRAAFKAAKTPPEGMA